MFSALHAIADIARQTSHVAFVPTADAYIAEMHDRIRRLTLSAQIKRGKCWSRKGNGRALGDFHSPAAHFTGARLQLRAPWRGSEGAAFAPLLD
jgi:hypothetical protein